MSIWHSPRIGGDIAEGLQKTIDALASDIKGHMYNVYWLGRESCPLRKITSMRNLAALHGKVLSRYYTATTPPAARDFTLSTALVLR